MKIKVARLYKLSGDKPLKALVDISLDDKFIVKGLRVIEGKKGLFVSMPKEKGVDKRWYDTVTITDITTKKEIEKAILEVYAK